MPSPPPFLAPRPEVLLLNMKRSGLLLVAAILAFVTGAAVAASLGRKNQAGRRRPPSRGNQPCVGCYTLLSAPRFPDERTNPFENITFPLLAESGSLPLRPAIETRSLGESTLLNPEPSKPRLKHKVEKEEKAVGQSRHRSRQRGGTRPVCRGCYSGLTIVAPPGYEGNQSTAHEESHSESAWESSSEEDGHFRQPEPAILFDPGSQTQTLDWHQGRNQA